MPRDSHDCSDICKQQVTRHTTIKRHTSHFTPPSHVTRHTLHHHHTSHITLHTTITRHTSHFTPQSHVTLHTTITRHTSHVTLHATIQKSKKHTGAAAHLRAVRRPLNPIGFRPVARHVNGVHAVPAAAALLIHKISTEIRGLWVRTRGGTQRLCLRATCEPHHRAVRRGLLQRRGRAARGGLIPRMTQACRRRV